MIKLDSAAVSEVTRLLKKPDHAGKYLRVGVAGGGCSGFEYKLDLLHEDEYDSKIYLKYEQDDINIVVDRKSGLYLDGTVITWHNELMKKGFSFDNPNANKTCGCGSSFSV